MNVYLNVLSVLAVLTAILFVRMVIGPTIWDRLLVLNTISSKMNMAIVILALIQGNSFLLDIALTYALLGYMGMVLIARFIERRGDL